MTSVTILIFPNWEAAMMSPWDAAMPRSPVMAISRPMITVATQADTRPISTSEMSAAAMSSLSAMGSRSCPRVVTCLRLLAIRPSSQSVRTAARKIAPAG